MAGAAASIFFAYVGFDSVSTAAEETRDPQRNVPIGLIGSLVICTLFYLIVAACVIGATSLPSFAQPVRDAAGAILEPGSLALADRCASLTGVQPVACSHEALAHVLRQIGWIKIGNLIGLAAFLALPSVVLMMMFGQIRVFFAMARDGLLPAGLARVHPRFRTPHIMTVVTGAVVMLMSAFLPVGKLVDYSNSGTLFAFAMVALAVLVLRRTDPTRHRPFRTPAVTVVAPLAVAGCAYLFFSLNIIAILVLPVWGALGLLIYFGYSRARSHVGRGITDADALDAEHV
jgi:basic amino acid/polyamine antiporter, APA family